MQELILVKADELITHQRRDSCRVCGNEIVPFHFCSECKQPYEFQCPKCQQLIDEQIHFGCRLNEKNTGLD